MNLINALNWRYAVKQFSADLICDQALQQLLTATTLSPSAYGLQPYRLLSIKSTDIRKQLVPYSMGQDKILHSSHLIVFASQTNISGHHVDAYISEVARRQGTSMDELQGMATHFKQALALKSPQELQAWAKNQTYLALGNFLTAAAILQIDSCPMEGFSTQGYDEVLGLAEKNLTTSVICPIGKRLQSDPASKLRKVRFSQQDMITQI